MNLKEVNELLMETIPRHQAKRIFRDNEELYTELASIVLSQRTVEDAAASVSIVVHLTFLYGMVSARQWENVDSIPGDVELPPYIKEWIESHERFRLGP